MKKELEKLKVIEQSLESQLSENIERQAILIRDIWLDENEMELGQIVFVSGRDAPLDSEWKKGILIDVLLWADIPKPVVKLYDKSGDVGHKKWHYRIQRIKK